MISHTPTTGEIQASFADGVGLASKETAALSPWINKLAHDSGIAADAFERWLKQHDLALREQLAKELETQGRKNADLQREHELAQGIWDGTGTSSPGEQEWHQTANWAARTVRNTPIGDLPLTQPHHPTQNV